MRKAGTLSSTQANQLFSPVGAINQQIVTAKQANGGTLTQTEQQAIHQQEQQLSQQIYSTGHGGSSTGN